MSFEENEISSKAFGGTELVKRAIAARIPQDLQDEFQIICSRVREIEDDKIRVYWLHDLPDDPETKHLKDEHNRNRFHKLVFCGNWQYNRYLDMLGVPPDDKCVVIDNAITPLEFKPKSKEEIRLIYTSTPQRGLAILVPVFMKLCEKYDNIYLDVFSSFEIYGWKDADQQFQELFEQCKNHPKIVYHGFSPNSVVREAYQNAHIFAYPSIWLECNSVALIEAMSAGLLCVHPNLAGLSDTSGNLTSMYQFDHDMNRHASNFYLQLEHAIEIAHKEEVTNYTRFVKSYADTRYNVDKIASQWEYVLGELKNQYPTVESRKPPGRTFIYKTT